MQKKEIFKDEFTAAQGDWGGKLSQENNVLHF
jgi:hypothetical protein